MAKRKKKTGKVAPSFPGIPPLPKAFPWKKDEKGRKKCAKAKKKLKADLKRGWVKSIGRQKAAMDGSKKQYEQLFAYLMDLEGDVAAALPDEAPSILGLLTLPLSPKELVEALKAYQELDNQHFTTLLDSFGDFIIQSQQQACDQIPAESDGEEEAEAEEELAEDETEEVEEVEYVEEPEAEEELVEEVAEEEAAAEEPAEDADPEVTEAEEEPAEEAKAEDEAPKSKSRSRAKGKGRSGSRRGRRKN
jgi:chemotaxis protein histidine kinase CheA